MKSIFKSIILSIYVFVVIGLIFHTSSRPEIFNKYTSAYFSLLIAIILLYLPFVKVTNYIFVVSEIKFRNKKYTFNPLSKVFLLIISSILFIWIPAEIAIRIVNVNYKTNPNVLSIKNFHPFLQHKLDISNNLDDKYMHVNSYGFKAEEISKSKLDGTYRIFVLGGSTVLNRNVSYEHNFVRILEKKLQKKYENKKVEVINSGVDGYTSQHTLIDFMFRIKDFNPDLVIVLQGINDMTSSCSPEGYSLGKYQPDYSHNFGSISDIIFSYFKNKPFISINSVLLNKIETFFKHNLYSDILNIYSNKQNKTIPTKKIDTFYFPSIASFRRNVTYLIQVAKMNNVKLILINQPTQYREEMQEYIWFAQRTCNTQSGHPSIKALIQGISQFNDATKQIAMQKGISFIDLNSELPKDMNYYIDDAHFTERGNKVISDILYKYLITNEIIQ